MAWFVKTETFTAVAAALSVEQRRPTLEAHRHWVSEEAAAGRHLRSGYLVDGDRRPGGGGLLMFEASSYADALAWVQNCLLYTSPSPRDGLLSRMPSSA